MLKLLGFSKYDTRLSFQDRVASLLILLVYMALVLVNQFRHLATTMIWYMAVVLCFCAAVYFCKGRIKLEIGTFAVLCSITALVNYLVVGNSELDSQIYSILCLGVVMLLLQQKINTNYLLVALYVNIVVVLFHIIRGGLQTYMEIYVTSSSNFVSVHLLFVATIYYSLLEKQGRNITLIPGLIVWIVCVLAMGRGGILAASVLLIGILLKIRREKFSHMKMQGRMLTSFIIIVALLAMVPYAIDMIVKNMDTNALLARFSLHGLSDNGRMPAWIEYIEGSFSGMTNFLWGASFKHMPTVTAYGDNLHNSFLNIHAFNGIIMLVYVLVLCVKSTMYALKNKKIVFLFAFMALAMRGFTDYVFWHTNGTPFFLFFLFFPLYEAHRKKRRKRFR